MRVLGPEGASTAQTQPVPLETSTKENGCGADVKVGRVPPAVCDAAPRRETEKVLKAS